MHTPTILFSHQTCRYELERGPGLLQVTTRLALSPFGSAATTTAAELAAAAEGALEASRQAVLGPDGSGLLDTVMLHWLDYEVRRGVGWSERGPPPQVGQGG